MSAVDTPESVRALADGIDHLQDSRQLRRHAAEVLSRYAALLAAPTQSCDVGEARITFDMVERATFALLGRTLTEANVRKALQAALTPPKRARLSAEEPQP